MTMKQLLMGRTNCPCGMNHACPTRYVEINENAFDILPELTLQFEHILVVADRNTYAVAGAQVAKKIGVRMVDLLIYECEGVLVPDETAIAALRSRVTMDTDLILGIGSGVINDLCKYVSFEASLPYYIVATAPSMDGYASKGAALILGGMKVTLPAQVPSVIIADLNILKNAPMEMIQAGYGDMIGKYSCLNDWKLASLVNGEYLCDFVVEATYEAVEKTIALADGLLARDTQAVGALMESLVAVGILMAYVENSRPASGSEHHLSHFFEIVGLSRGEGYLPHGIDVGFSAIETAKMREELLAIEDISSYTSNFDRADYEKNIRRIYGTVADEVLALQEKLGWYAEDRVAIYREKWDEIRALLADAPHADRMLAMTEKIGLSYDRFLTFYGSEKLEDAKWYAKDLKDRYSVLWMYFDLMH